MLSHSAIVHNILSVYRQATREDIDSGKVWYPRAHQIVCDWADTFQRSIANIACVIAAISPQCEWTRNLIIADDILRGYPPSVGGAILRFVRIAEKIRDDRAGDTVSYFKQGCKVRSFAANLVGDWNVVTVDTHGAQIAAGSPTSNIRVDTWHRYEPVATAYIDAARHVGIYPATFQAITWHTWKRLYPQGKKIHLRKRW